MSTADPDPGGSQVEDGTRHPGRFPHWVVPSLAGVAGGVAGYAAIAGGLTKAPTTAQLAWSIATAVIGGATAFFTAAAGGLGIDRLRKAESAILHHHQPPKVFLSYLPADLTWADWIVGLLSLAGFRVIRQNWEDWEVVAGGDTASPPRQPLVENACVMILLSATFVASSYNGGDRFSRLIEAKQGWQPPFLVQIEACQLPEWLASHVAVDLAESAAATAAERLLGKLAARGFTVPAELSFEAGAEYNRKFPGRGPEISNVPPRNSHFADRLDILGVMQQTLLSAPTTEPQVCAINGLGGVGKTQTVIEFAHRFGSHYDIIWWVRAEQQVSIADHLTTLARELGVSAAAEQSRMLAGLWRELRQRDRWLLIFDNAPNPRTLVPFWPPGGSGDVIVTSRHLAWGSVGGHSVQVKPFDRSDAITFLRNRTKSSEEAAAVTVAEALGCLPLALEQAAAYVEETQTSLQTYENLLSANYHALLAAGKPNWYTGTVATTWTVSIKGACAEQPLARDLLALFAYLAPDDIPRNLAQSHATALSSPLREAVADPVRYDQIVAALMSFSLIAADPYRIGIHRLVQLTVQDQLDPGERVSSHGDSVRLLSAAFPANPTKIETWQTCGRLLAHVSLATRNYQELLPAHAAELGTLLQHAGRYLHVRGEYREARLFLERALDIRSTSPGLGGTARAETLSSLGRVYYHLANLAEARRVTELALAFYRETLGQDAPPAGESMLHLSRIVRELGDFAGAEQIARDFLHVFGQSRVSNDPMVAVGEQALGDALWRLGRLDDARGAYQEALRIRGSTTADPVDLASCHKHIGIVSAELGDLGLAEHEFREARSLLSQVYDDEDLDMADVNNHLADVLRRTGHAAEARPLLERVLLVRERVLDEHPDVAGSLVKYGATLSSLGDNAGAMSALERACQMFAKRMGTSHPYVAEAKLALAEALRAAGQRGPAQASAREALDINMAAFGPMHRQTINAQQLLDDLRTTGGPGATFADPGPAAQDQSSAD